MQADPIIIADLQNTCQSMASLSGQYAVDVCQLKAMDLDWLACRVKKWKSCTDEQLEFAQSCSARKQAWEIRADYVPDIYEHLVGCLEKQIFKIERELRLIKALGGESQYIAARLDDGGK